MKLDALLDLGFTTEKPKDPKYVLTVVYNSARQLVVSLIKDSSISELAGRITFPGGRVEPTDVSLEHAASREFREETGLSVLPESWTFVAGKPFIAIFMAESEDIMEARTCEHEPVGLLAVIPQLKYSNLSPQHYADDFNAILQVVADKITTS